SNAVQSCETSYAAAKRSNRYLRTSWPAVVERSERDVARGEDGVPNHARERAALDGQRSSERSQRLGGGCRSRSEDASHLSALETGRRGRADPARQGRADRGLKSWASSLGRALQRGQRPGPERLARGNRRQVEGLP